MSKRRREIKKRKRITGENAEGESLQVQESAEDVVISREEPQEDPDTEELAPAESPLDDSQIVSAAAPAPAGKPAAERKTRSRQPKGAPEADSWLGRNKENFLLGLLVLYVLLLGLGTVGELFEIEWILNLPLFR